MIENHGEIAQSDAHARGTKRRNTQGFLDKCIPNDE